MKKIMFNDKFGLTQAVLEGRKTMTRRIVPENTPFGNWAETVNKSRYKVGEIVAVAQSYKDIREEWGGESGVSPFVAKAGYRNKMYVRSDLMPHRIRITSVRVERLQDISDEDCIREGIRIKSNFPHKKSLPFYFDGGKHGWDNSFSTPRQAFAALIDKVSGKGTWESNPWVFVYEFELVR